MQNKSDPRQVFRRVYISQIEHSKVRGQNPPNYTFEQFIYWLNQQPNLITLWDNWQNSNYDSKLKPSVDRIDENLSYTLSNIQLMTWEENYLKAQKDRKLGKRIIDHKRVRSINTDGSICKNYISIKEAARDINGDPTKISNVANSKILTHASDGHKYIMQKHRGFKWEFY